MPTISLYSQRRNLLNLSEIYEFVNYDLIFKRFAALLIIIAFFLENSMFKKILLSKEMLI